MPRHLAQPSNLLPVDLPFGWDKWKNERWCFGKGFRPPQLPPSLKKALPESALLSLQSFLRGRGQGKEIGATSDVRHAHLLHAVWFRNIAVPPLA
jgi:hypothetical protein